jgi:hypothetical protein
VSFWRGLEAKSLSVSGSSRLNISVCGRGRVVECCAGRATSSEKSNRHRYSATDWKSFV